MVNIRLSGIVFLVFFQILIAEAQKKYLFSQDYWHRGQVQLNSGKVLEGYVKYQLSENVVQLKQKGNFLKTFNSSQIRKFSIFDTLTKVNRSFYTLQAKNLVDLKGQYAYFELIYEDQISLLSREKISPHQVQGTTQPKNINQFYDALEDEFYLLNSRGKLEKIKNLEKLATLIEENKANLKDFIHSNQLDLHKRKDFSTLIQHYNQVISARKSTNPNKEVNNNAGGF